MSAAIDDGASLSGLREKSDGDRRRSTKTWDEGQIVWDPVALSATSLDDGLRSSVPRRGRPRSKPYRCQVCDEDVSEAKYYHKRYRICSVHSGPQVQTIGGKPQLWCQQCGQFQRIEDFDAGRRTCRARLKQHALKKSQRRQARASASEDEDEQQPAESSLRSYTTPSGSTPSPSGPSPAPSKPASVGSGWGIPQPDPATALGLYHDAAGGDGRLLLQMQPRSVHSSGGWGSGGEVEMAGMGQGLLDPGASAPASDLDLALDLDFAGIGSMVQELLHLPSQPGGDASVLQADAATSAAADALASASAAAVAGAPGYAYNSPLVAQRWSLKLFGVTPEHLSPAIRAELNAMLGGQALVEGYIRQGCVHLTLDLLVEKSAAKGFASEGMLGAAARLLDGRLLQGVDRPLPALLQIEERLAVGRRGSIQALVQLGGGLVPRLERVRPLAVLQGRAELALTGRHLGGEGVQFFCRAAGGFVDVQVDESAHAGADGAVAAGGSGRLHLQLGTLPVGCASLEVQRGALMSRPLALLVAPSVEVVEEVRRLEIDSSAVGDVDTFLHEVGLVLRYLERRASPDAPVAALPVTGAALAAIAQRTAVAAAMFGWPALTRELLRGATAGGVSPAAAAGAMDALAPGKTLPRAVPRSCAHDAVQEVLAEWAAAHGMALRWRRAVEEFVGPSVSVVGVKSDGAYDGRPEEPWGLDLATTAQLATGGACHGLMQGPWGAAWHAAAGAAAAAAAAGAFALRMLLGSV